MSSRFNNPATGVRVIIMQRLNEDDLTGHVLEKETGYVHLRLPARFELENRCKTSIGFTDPRTYDGEPLWKEMYGEEALSRLEKELGSEYAIAGQLQQRPSVRGGGLFKIEKFEYVRNVHPMDIVKSVRYWDKGGTTDKSNAQSSSTLMHKLKDNSFVIAHSVSGQWTATKREKMILQIAQNDGVKVIVYVEQEPGSGGLESAVGTVRNLAGFSCGRDKVTGSKEIRAEPYATQVEIGNVKLVEASWNKDFIAQHELFPKGRLKDMVDSASGAFNMLTKKSRAGAWGKRT
jgi:predicted phage terminase large subunit-like protein